jgi:hypothetical protein
MQEHSPYTYTNSKSKRYFCWRRCRLPRRMYNTPRRLRLAPLKWDSSTNEFQFTAYCNSSFTAASISSLI